MTDFSAHDTELMARALGLAERGLATARPNPVVGCVLAAADGQVIGEGWHERTGGPHAEVIALDAAGGKARGAAVYITLEPCSHHGRTPPCADRLIAAGVARVIYAVADPNPQVAGEGAAKLKAAGIEVASGLLAQQATQLNRGFFSRMQRGRPWVRLKLAASLDGRTALANGDSKWITGGAARADVHRARARSGAVLTGIGTVLADDPALTARPDGVAAELQPIRVVLDSELNTPVDAKLLSEPGQTLICHATAASGKAAALENAGAELRRMESSAAGVDFDAVFAELVRREVNDVWVEAGAALAGALLSAGLVDELLVYQAASVLGDSARGMFALPTLTDMDERLQFELEDVRRVGDDLRLTYVPLKN
jgi:diaminohydroxyphosphoribosylaminopyrimidine deaminase/5-amino-6-(5-phosphoribosylamino)uracil reductase